MPRKIDNSLSAKQERAIVALLNEPTMQRAAATVGVSDRTLTRWMRDPVFNTAFRRARRETFQHAMSLAQKYAPVALNTLAVISSDRAAPYASRVSASKAVLGFGRESIELDDLMQRVEQLELDLGPGESTPSGNEPGATSALPSGGDVVRSTAQIGRRVARVRQRRADPGDLLFDGPLDEHE